MYKSRYFNLFVSVAVNTDLSLTLPYKTLCSLRNQNSSLHPCVNHVCGLRQYCLSDPHIELRLIFWSLCIYPSKTWHVNWRITSHYHLFTNTANTICHVVVAFLAFGLTWKHWNTKIEAHKDGIVGSLPDWFPDTGVQISTWTKPLNHLSWIHFSSVQQEQFSIAM